MEEGSALRFVAAPPPTRGEVLAVAVRIVARVTRWLKKHGYLRKETDSNEAPGLSSEETLAKAAMSRGSVSTLREDDGEPSDSKEGTRPATTEAVVHQGFNLHASVTIAAADDMGRERLCRYGLRPPLHPVGYHEARSLSLAFAFFVTAPSPIG